MNCCETPKEIILEFCIKSRAVFTMDFEVLYVTAHVVEFEELKNA